MADLRLNMKFGSKFIDTEDLEKLIGASVYTDSNSAIVYTNFNEILIARSDSEESLENSLKRLLEQVTGIIYTRTSNDSAVRVLNRLGFERKDGLFIRKAG